MPGRNLFAILAVPTKAREENTFRLLWARARTRAILALYTALHFAPAALRLEIRDTWYNIKFVTLLLPVRNTEQLSKIFCCATFGKTRSNKFWRYTEKKNTNLVISTTQVWKWKQIFPVQTKNFHLERVNQIKLPRWWNKYLESSAVDQDVGGSWQWLLERH